MGEGIPFQFLPDQCHSKFCLIWLATVTQNNLGYASFCFRLLGPGANGISIVLLHYGRQNFSWIKRIGCTNKYKRGTKFSLPRRRSCGFVTQSFVETRDEPLRTFAWEARRNLACRSLLVVRRKLFSSSVCRQQSRNILFKLLYDVFYFKLS